MMSCRKARARKRFISGGYAAVLEEFHALAPAELSHRLNVRLTIVSAVPRCPAGRLEDSAHAVSL